MPNAIELIGVTKRFKSHTAVERLNLVVPEGAIYGFVGPNGSGKTTTLRMILRIFQPEEGLVRVLGKAHGSAADARLGYLPEERGLYKRMKVRDVLRYYARLKNFYRCDGEIDHWLARLGASDWANKKIDSLSKGMAQKVQFIASVVARPQLVILDEPFSGLDPVNLESLKDAVLSLRERGATVVFSTHDMSMAERLCDTVFMIYQGKKVLDGSIAEIQAKYPANEVKCRIEYFPADGSDNKFGESPIPLVDGISNLRFGGGYHRFDIDDPTQVQGVMQALASQRVVSHFEVVKPSLHDIFVKIAGQQESV